MYNVVDERCVNICTKCGHVNRYSIFASTICMYNWFSKYKIYKTLYNMYLKCIDELSLFPNELSKIITEFIYENHY